MGPSVELRATSSAGQLAFHESCSCLGWCSVCLCLDVGAVGRHGVVGVASGRRQVPRMHPCWLSRSATWPGQRRCA